MKTKYESVEFERMQLSLHRTVYNCWMSDKETGVCLGEIARSRYSRRWISTIMTEHIEIDEQAHLDIASFLHQLNESAK